jgi:hypothetical protein
MPEEIPLIVAAGEFNIFTYSLISPERGKLFLYAAI